MATKKKTPVESAEQDETVSATRHKALKQSDEERERCQELARLVGNPRNVGFVPYAYALIPDQNGRYVAVELRRVSFLDVQQADPNGPFRERLEVEDRARAQQRLESGTRNRSRCPNTAGWDGTRELNRKGLVDIGGRRVPRCSPAAVEYRRKQREVCIEEEGDE